jgi:DNA-binding CsgD family transcriptional regulator
VREAPLTTREQEIGKLIAESYSNQQIADALVISVKSVERHRASILEKLGMHDNVQLTRWRHPASPQSTPNHRMGSSRPRDEAPAPFSGTGPRVKVTADQILNTERNSMIRSHTNHTRDTTRAGGRAAPPTRTASQDRPSLRVLAVIRSDGSRFKLLGPVTPNQLHP